MKKMPNRNFWMQGSGEILGFMYTLPVLLSIMVMLIAVIQVGALKERLEYTAYVGCRAAVVAKDYETARKNAEETIKNDLASSQLNYDPESLEISVKLIEDSSVSKNVKNKWSKGNYVQCDVKVRIKTVTPLVSGMKRAQITMMIERPAEDMAWFEGGD